MTVNDAEMGHVLFEDTLDHLTRGPVGSDLSPRCEGCGDEADLPSAGSGRWFCSACIDALAGDL